MIQIVATFCEEKENTRKLGLLLTEQLMCVRVPLVEKAHLLNFNLIPD